MTSWREQAACEPLSWDDKRFFFGDAPDIGTHKQHEMARMYCYQCPVQIECLRYCVDEDMYWGVWGGLTESQRKRYLMPAIRKEGFTFDVVSNILRVRGAKIIRRLTEMEIGVTIDMPVLHENDMISSDDIEKE